jgi:hypothetical protein
MSPSIELSPPDPSSASTFGKVAKRRHHQQQLLQQQQPVVKVVSPRELKDIVARLSRSPGDLSLPPPSTYYSSGSHQQKQQQRAIEHDQQQQPASSFRPITPSAHSSQEPPQALRDLLPQASQGRGHSLSLNLASAVGSKSGAARCDAALFAFAFKYFFMWHYYCLAFSASETITHIASICCC